jgi:hypothetical protein
MPRGLEGRVFVVFVATADRSGAPATRPSPVGLSLVAEGGSGLLTWLIPFHPLRWLSFLSCMPVSICLQASRLCALLYENPHIEVSNEYRFSRVVMNFLLPGFAPKGPIFGN